MLQSFFVYITFGLILFILGRLAQIRERANLLQNKTTPFWVWEVILALFVFAFVSGVRWNVGVDHLSYLNNYLSLQNGGYSLFDKEIGFEFITSVLAKSGIHFSFYFGLLAFLQLFFIYRALKDQRYLYPFLGIVIIFGPEYLNWMNGIRQMLAATIFVFSIQFIVKRQFLKYLFTILCASLFHTSALILLIFYIIPQKDYFKNRKFTLVLVAISLLIGSMTFWVNQLSQLSFLLKYIGYDWYSENIELLIADDEMRNIGPRRISMILVPILIIWFSPKLKATFKHTHFLSFYNITVVGFIFYNIFANMNHGFIRPITYLTVFTVPSSAFLLAYLYFNIKKSKAIMFISLIIMMSYLPLSVLADSGKGTKDFSNYKFYWYNFDK